MYFLKEKQGFLYISADDDHGFDMECSGCGKRDPSRFQKSPGGYFCRKPIRFSRVLPEEQLSYFDHDIVPDIEEYHFYETEEKQKTASKQCPKALKENDALSHYACGAGCGGLHGRIFIQGNL